MRIRDYADPGSQIDVYMFDDRIEIRNPGSLAGGLTRDDLIKKTGKRYLRNPNLANLLYELKLVEKAGTGVIRIFKDMEENGSPPPDYIVDANSVKIILPAQKDYTAQRKYEEGLLAKDRGEITRARKLFEEALQFRPNYSEALAALASLEGEVGPIEKARELYRSATDRDPHNIRAMLDWATLEARQGNYQEARKVYERISKVDPNNTIALHTWGLLERRLGNLPKGRELFQRVSQIDPENMANLQAWGQLENKARNHQEAVRLLERALHYADDDFSKAWIHSDLAFAKGHLKVPKTEVEDHYKTSLALNPNSPQTNHQYADFLLRLGRGYEAEQYEAKARLLGWKEPKRRFSGRR